MERNDLTNAELDSGITTESKSPLILFQLISLEENPNDSLHFIVKNSSEFLSILNGSHKDSSPDLTSVALNVLGRACNAENSLRQTLNKLLLTLSAEIDTITINIQRHLVAYEKFGEKKKCHLDALYNLTEFLKTIQLTLPSSSLYAISILLPILTCTCDTFLKINEELHAACSQNLKLLENEQKCFYEHHSLYEEKKMSEMEKMHFLEPPENFRTLSILPTADDVSLPCSFLRPNITKGRYKDTEHYLDVQFRLLKEDYIKPLRDGIAEYLLSKKNDKDVKKCKNVRVYENAYVSREEFVDGDLLHVIQFQEKYFSTVNWECSKRFIKGNLLCFTTDSFRTMMFATVILRKTDEIKKGLLHVKFESANDKLLNLDLSLRYIVIEVPTLFESYCHTLNVLQQFTEDTLPMKKYIIDVENILKEPQYLSSTTTYDFRPLLIPLHEYRNVKKYQNIKFSKYKNVPVMDDCKWPSASELLLDDSQYSALKSAITKEFSIIQGPPGTGKTYIGLRTVQLLLHNIDNWYEDEPDTLPILIVCYTNHALDQFLEGISKLTRKIVRIGGRVQNEAIEPFQIRNLVRRANYSGEMPIDIIENISDSKDHIRFLKNRIEELGTFEKYSTDYVFHENILKEHIPILQFNSLLKVNKNESETGQIFTWLEIETSETSEDDIHDPISHIRTVDGHTEIDAVGDEGDVEFIENQRDVEYYDFEDMLTLNRSSNSNGKLQHRENNSEYVKNSLKNNPTMIEHRALKIKNVWYLPINERWQLYKFWLENFLSVKRQEYFELQRELKDCSERLSRLRVEQDLFVIQDAFVVGMTTTGAAKYRHLIEKRNPVILIVEEAAEILESHIITSLAPTTQHVILIGDQQQLRPSPTVHLLAVKYGMNVSLFERMINNGIEYRQLTLQHRMRPEISALIVPHIYPNLRNHQSVSLFENISGVNKNVYFINHHYKELNVEDSKSKVNDHEARFIVRLCRYLIHQGYAPSKITVLTTYTGQLFTLKKLVKDEEVKKVRFTVVDNYQGEENDIILISFVRSNNKGEVGFLKVSNRICVALSRAKKGLYCIGNFELLAEKSNLWQNIVQTLKANDSFGPTLRLCCQNHPDLFNDVAKDSDFNAVPEGGCKIKCDFRLSCGHACPLFCHPYDREHRLFRCKKPCVKNCDQGHLCQKQCWEKCEPCPVMVDKTLPRCGHSAYAPCGFDIHKIKCMEPCLTVCEEGHPCPKKCFEDCGDCKISVEIILTKCGHTVQAPCFKQIHYIFCTNQCGKSCEKGHPCQKKCHVPFPCRQCKVLVDKKLSSCGHTVKAACYEPESEIECRFQCGKVLPCSHQCMKKCYEVCEKICKQISEIQSTICGHTLKIECYLRNDSDAVSRRCPEPCRDILACGHSCKGTCSRCKQKTAHVLCEKTCEKILHCGHKCTNKCCEPCVQKCMKLVKVESPICGHLVEIECEFAQNLTLLSKKCSQYCKTVLRCGHTCKGTCGKCYQGRLHVFCNEPCEKILICGHKCRSKCFKSCPPCTRPCENSCVHKRCSRKCGDPCVKCTKRCNWSCQHKKCSRRCDEVCDRDPCTFRCPHKLPCGHQCIGFCGEPCPKACFICHTNNSETDSSDVGNMMNDQSFSGYVLLENCQHIVKDSELNDEWINDHPGKLEEIKMKTCPKCGSIVRANVRYGKIIKNVLSDVESIKHIARWDEKKNLEIQRSLLELVKSSHPNINVLYKHIIKMLSGGDVRSIQELTAIENVINIANEIELKNYGIHSMFVLKPFHETLVFYTRSCREIMKDFILFNFLTMSEYQLYQLSRELYRLSLLDHLLMLAERNHFASLSPDFERLATSLTTFTPFTNEDVESIRKKLENFTANLKIPLNNFPNYTKTINMSGDWYRCAKEHFTCVRKCKDNTPLICYACNETERNSNERKLTVDEDVEYTLDEPDAEKVTQSLIAKQSNVKPLRRRNLVKSGASILLYESDKFTNNAKYDSPFLRNSNTQRQYGTVTHTDNFPQYRKTINSLQNSLGVLFPKRTGRDFTQKARSNETNLPVDAAKSSEEKSADEKMPVGTEVRSHYKRSPHFQSSISFKLRHKVSGNTRDGGNKTIKVSTDNSRTRSESINKDKLSTQSERSSNSLRRSAEVLKDLRAGTKAAVKVKSTDNSRVDTESKSRDKLSAQSERSSNSLRRSAEVLKDLRAGTKAAVKVKSTDNSRVDTESKSQDKLSAQSERSSNSLRRSEEVLKDLRAGTKAAVKVKSTDNSRVGTESKRRDKLSAHSERSSNSLRRSAEVLKDLRPGTKGAVKVKSTDNSRVDTESKKR